MKDFMYSRYRADIANKWCFELEDRYGELVGNAIAHTMGVHFDNGPHVVSGQQLAVIEQDNVQGKTEVLVRQSDVVSTAVTEAINMQAGDKLCVLNFASYKHPGGAFLRGALTQEESLCHSTGLFHCLRTQHAWYALHKNNTNGGLYSDDFIYSQDVPLVYGSKVFLIDILTMAAPNQRKAKISCKEVFNARIKLAYTIPAKFGVNILILGAWGCGVFGNDTLHVTQRWKECSDNTSLYRKVVHPITSDGKYKIFSNVFNES